jgi:hypothetical protein
VSKDVDTSAEDAAEEERAPAGAGPTRPPALVLAVSLAVLFGVLAAVFAILAVSGDDGEGGRVGDLRRTAGEMAEAFFTWDYQDLDAHRDRVLALATGSFRSSYDEEFDGSLRELITTTESTSQAFVNDVYVSEIDEERAEAVVVVDLEQTGTGGPRTTPDIYLLITFVEVDGDWKVDDVTDPFPIRSAPDGAGGPGSSSTTTAPAPVP